MSERRQQDEDRAEASSADLSGRGPALSAGERKAGPGTWELLRPKGFVRFWQLWWRSRPVKFLAFGLPFVVASVAAAAYVRRLQASSPYAAVPKFERALRLAIDEDRIDEALILMKGLAELSPDAPRHKYNRALLMIDHESREAGLAQMLALASREGAGYVPARMWLVRQAQSDKPLVQLSPDEVLFQLQQVAKQSPQDQAAQEMLAQMYLERNELWLAEKHLTDAARGMPEINLLLARVQRQLGRDPAAVAETLERARTRFQGRLADFPTDAAARVGWAECLQLEGKLSEGEALLREGLANQPSRILREGLSKYYSDVAALKIRESSQNMPLAANLTTSALRENPDNASAIELLLRLYLSNVAFPADSLEPALRSYAERAERKALPAEGARAYAAVLGAAGRPGEGAEILAASDDDSPTKRRLLLELYRDAGQSEAAGRLIDALVADAERRVAAEPADLNAAIEHSAALVAGERFEAALAALEDYRERSGTELAAQPLLFRDAFAGACLGLYDQQHSANAADADWDLLRQVLASGSQAEAAVVRLAALSFADVPSSPDAEQLLQRLAAGGRGSAAIYGYLGAYAEQAGDNQRARRYLERALAAQPTDPIMKNNLASVLVQGSEEDLQRALMLVEEALEALPQHPSLLTTRAEIYAATSRWEEACLDLVALLPMRSEVAEHHRKLERAYDQLGEADLAAQHRRLAEELEKTAATQPPQ
jgi:predicted Zn-dependent protease